MSRLLPVLGFTLLLLVANWPYEYQEVLNQPIGNNLDLLSVVAINSQHEPPTFAGWPFKFYVSVPDENEPCVIDFSWFALAVNLCFWSLIPVVFVIYERFLVNCAKRSDALVIEQEESVFDFAEAPKKRKRPRTSKYDRKRKRRSVQLADIFVFTALIACVFGYWQWLQSRAELDRKLGSEIANNGNGVVRTAMLPWLARDLRRLLGHEAFLRVSEVRLSEPDDQLLTKVVALPYLRTLRITGGDYDFRSLGRLASNPLFAELAVVGRPLNEDAIVAIRSLKSLRKLNLMQTDIDTAGMAAIDHSRLRELNLVQTEVQLSELGTPAFAKTLRKLSLPHSAKAGRDSLYLDGWPELTELECIEFDKPKNAEPVAITLKNLPKLYRIELDTLQKFDIDCEQLPALSKFESVCHQWEKRATPAEIVPDFLWVGKLRMKNVPNLSALTIFAADTQEIEIDHGALQITLNVHNKGEFRAPSKINTRTGRYREMGNLTSEDIPLATRQKWIDDLAACPGLEKISLQSAPLEDVSLKPLVGNQSVRELVLDSCVFSVSQLHELQGMEQLQVLSLVGTSVDGKTIEWLATSLPDLRKIRCALSYIGNLSLENVPNLESLFAFEDVYESFRYINFQPEKQINSLKLVNVPLLRDHFVLNGRMKQLHIESAPSLSGLSFQEPLPANAVLKGLANLKFFAAGGPTCTDTIVTEVLACKGLRRLTLVYTNLSPSNWQKIGELRDLEYLVLTGSNVNDELVQSIATLDNLRTLQLGQTEITRAAIPAVSKLKNLESLDLEGLALAAKDVSQLTTSLTKLKRLSLAGAELTAENMQQISQLYSIESLDLSGCKLTDKLISAFLKSPPPLLIELKLNSATFSAEGFARLARELRYTRFAVKDTKIGLNQLDSLIAKGRALEHDHEDGPTRAVRTAQMLNYSVNGQRVEAPHVSDIDPSKFAPKKKDSAWSQ